MNTNSFDWTLVRSFLAALDRGSLLGAAQQLGLSQPTLGRHIADLESQLGTVLFERTGRGLRPTDAALDLAPSARAMQEAALAMAHRLSGTQQALQGSVRLTASQPVASHLLPPVLQRMRLALPGIQVVLVVDNAVSNLLQREADIALRMVRPNQASLVAQRIADIRLSACASRSYLARRGTPQQPTDLLQHDLVGYDQNTEILRGFAAMGYPLGPEAFSLRTDDMNAYWAAVRAGMGVGFIADHVRRHDPEVLPLLPQLPLPTLPMWLTVHREVRTSARIRAVYDFLAQAVPEALAQPPTGAGLTNFKPNPGDVVADTE